MPGGENAAEAGQENADREIERAQHLHVDAKRGDGLEIERAGADANAEPRIAQQHEQQRHRDHHHGHHEQAIAGDEEQIIAQRLRQERRDGDRLALRPQMKRVPSSMMKARPKVSSRL